VQKKCNFCPKIAHFGQFFALFCPFFALFRGHFFGQKWAKSGQMATFIVKFMLIFQFLPQSFATKVAKNIKVATKMANDF